MGSLFTVLENEIVLPSVVKEVSHGTRYSFLLSNAGKMSPSEVRSRLSLWLYKIQIS